MFIAATAAQSPAADVQRTAAAAATTAYDDGNFRQCWGKPVRVGTSLWRALPTTARTISTTDIDTTVDGAVFLKFLSSLFS